MTVSTSAAGPRGRLDRGLYTGAALLAVAVVFAGFARSYYLKTVFGAQSLSSLVHLHGAIMTLWFLLFVVQVWLVERRQVALHRKLGMFGGALALLVVAVGTMTSIVAARNGVTAGPPPLVFMAVPLGDMVVFALLVSVGLAYRNHPAIHKRLLLLSSLSMLTAAIARIPLDVIQQGGLPVAFALNDLVVLAAVGIDTVRHRRLHPAFGWGVALVVASQVFRIWFSGTPQWNAFAQWLIS